MLFCFVLSFFIVASFVLVLFGGCFTFFCSVGAIFGETFLCASWEASTP